MDSFVFWAIIGLILAFIVRKALRGDKGKRAGAAGSTDVRAGVRHVAFDYLDQKGKMTNREVTAQRYRDGKVFAHCHLRREQRTFLIENIIGPVTDTETGELLDARAWAEAL